jgi:hypothetical protein
MLELLERECCVAIPLKGCRRHLRGRWFGTYRLADIDWTIGLVALGLDFLGGIWRNIEDILNDDI